MIRKMSDREHILARPSMYIGAVDTTSVTEFVMADGGIKQQTVNYVPGLIKIINEIIDNSVDQAIRTNFKECDEISVKMTDEFVEVKDNGSGIPVVKNADGMYLAQLAWGHARAGSNFDDDKNRTQIGMNGVGSFATNCFSKKFTGTTDDGKNKYTVVFSDNASSFKETVGATSGSTGVHVKFVPDLERFGLKKIDENHHLIIQQRLLNLSMSFPQITFKFNNKKVNVGSFKKYVQLFGQDFEVFESEEYRFAILSNPEDDFRQVSYVNGLKISDGGSHIDYITSNVIGPIRDKLLRKYKGIKPGDVKNKLMVVAFMTGFKNAKFNSQSKEKITNSQGEVSSYFGNLDFSAVADRVLKNKGIIEPITEVYRIKEEMKRRQELKGLQKAVKKIRSDKYLPPISKKKYLFLVEGDSALGGLSPVLGRKDCGYFVLRGKPLNAYSAAQSKFAGNAELTELFQVLKNEDYEKIVFATDQDLDGFHIRGLLTGFFLRYVPEVIDRLGMLQTPVIVVKKNNKLVRWYYNLNDSTTLKAGETSKYMKGLGSFKSSDLEQVLAADGLEKMIDFLEFDNLDVIDDWLSDKKSDVRKEYLVKNEFCIAKA